jgi:predicted PurR-regulated permease PerM
VAVLAVVVLYTVIQQVEGAVLVPWIQGDAVQLHPSVVIFVLIVGGAIGGLVGAILSIPITAAGFAVYRYLFRRLSDDPPAAAVEAAAPDEPVEPEAPAAAEASEAPGPPAES